MVQRAAVARAVLHDPPVLLLDEPREGLDPAASDMLDPLVGRSSGRTRVVVSHDFERVLGDCDLALGLRGGRQAFAGRASPDEVRGLYA
jgi:ABC-type transporter Mla maintaining outer membrane lipid asymmetry ATPase subunit MlaF